MLRFGDTGGPTTGSSGCAKHGRPFEEAAEVRASALEPGFDSFVMVVRGGRAPRKSADRSVVDAMPRCLAFGIVEVLTKHAVI